VQGRLAEVRAQGAELVAVTQSRPEALAALLRVEPRPFPFLCDPERAAYRAFGLGRGSWWMFLRPRVLASYLWGMARGWRPRRPVAGEDVLQLGGDFLLDRDGRLAFARRSADPGDRPAAEELIRRLTALSSGRGPGGLPGGGPTP
jgi:peroxiredoxin